ncbi:MAG: hypothetical protein ACI9GK_001887 [Devosia sp.]|jgi:hypothetical protein|tara:strand:+ start:52320 stop:52649 length:330 start_codon:yes stop_codon:yes gene_type:complete
MRLVVAGLVWAVLAGVAVAEPAQCTVTGFGTFDCELSRDGGGLTFGLPDGQVFAFALVGEGEGLGYLTPVDAGAGTYPVELGLMTAAVDAPGCWVGGKDDFSFCALVAQ